MPNGEDEEVGPPPATEDSQLLPLQPNDEEEHGFQAEYDNVKEAIEEHLQEADEGDNFFLDMALTRNLSLLPTKHDMEEAVMHLSQQGGQHQEESTTEQPLEQPLKPGEDDSKPPPLRAYLNLAAAVVALSSIGPFLDRFDDVPPPLKIVWRMQGTAIVLLPLAAHSAWSRPPDLSISQWCTFLTAVACYCTMTVAFAVSLDYTTVNDATILTNSQSLLLVIAKLFTGSKVALMEGVGVIVAFAGAVLCAKDSAEAAAPSGSADAVRNLVASNALVSLFGDTLALFSAIAGIGYIMLGKSVRSHLEVYVFVWLNMTVGSSMILAFMTLAGEQFSYSSDRQFGVWGWVNLEPDRLPVEIATVVICNIIGTMGYVRAFQHFSGVVITVASLMEPVTATFIAVLLNVGAFPGWIGWIGNIMVIVGTLAVF